MEGVKPVTKNAKTFLKDCLGNGPEPELKVIAKMDALRLVGQRGGLSVETLESK